MQTFGPVKRVTAKVTNDGFVDLSPNATAYAVSNGNYDQITQNLAGRRIEDHTLYPQYSEKPPIPQVLYIKRHPEQDRDSGHSSDASPQRIPVEYPPSINQLEQQGRSPQVIHQAEKSREKRRQANENRLVASAKKATDPQPVNKRDAPLPAKPLRSASNAPQQKQKPKMWRSYLPPPPPKKDTPGPTRAFDPDFLPSPEELRAWTPRRKNKVIGADPKMKEIFDKIAQPKKDYLEIEARAAKTIKENINKKKHLTRQAQIESQLEDRRKKLAIRKNLLQIDWGRKPKLVDLEHPDETFFRPKERPDYRMPHHPDDKPPQNVDLFKKNPETPAKGHRVKVALLHNWSWGVDQKKVNETKQSRKLHYHPHGRKRFAPLRRRFVQVFDLKRDKLTYIMRKRFARNMHRDPCKFKRPPRDHEFAEIEQKMLKEEMEKPYFRRIRPKNYLPDWRKEGRPELKRFKTRLHHYWRRHDLFQRYGKAIQRKILKARAAEVAHKGFVLCRMAKKRPVPTVKEKIDQVLAAQTEKGTYVLDADFPKHHEAFVNERDKFKTSKYDEPDGKYLGMTRTQDEYRELFRADPALQPMFNNDGYLKYEPANAVARNAPNDPIWSKPPPEFVPGEDAVEDYIKRSYNNTRVESISGHLTRERLGPEDHPQRPFDGRGPYRDDFSETVRKQKNFYKERDHQKRQPSGPKYAKNAVKPPGKLLKQQQDFQALTSQLAGGARPPYGSGNSRNKLSYGRDPQPKGRQSPTPYDMNRDAHARLQFHEDL